MHYIPSLMHGCVQKNALLRAIPALKGDLEEGRAHVLTDYPDKRYLTCQVWYVF